MFARINIITREGDLQQKMLPTLKDTVFASMQEQKGFQNLYLLSDSSGNKSYLISLWDSEADLQNWIKSDKLSRLSEQLRKDHPEWPGPPPYEDYPVIYQAKP